MLGRGPGLARAARCCAYQASGSRPLIASHGSCLLHNRRSKACQAALPRVAVQDRMRSSSAASNSADSDVTQLQSRWERWVPAARPLMNIAFSRREVFTTRAVGDEGSGDSARSTADVDAELRHLTNQIVEVQAQITSVMAKIEDTDKSKQNMLELALASTGGDKEFLQQQVAALGTQLQQLRAEQQQLRAEQQQLRAKELELLRQKPGWFDGYFIPLPVHPSGMTHTVCTALQAQAPDGQLAVGQQPKLLNFVPPYASPPVPLLLLDPAFGKLCDTIDGGRRVRLKEEDYQCANLLVQAASRMYNNERQRVAAVLPILKHYLGGLDCSVTDSPTWSIAQIRPDMAVQCSEGGHNIPLVFVEVKNSRQSGNADPYFQCAAYHYNYWRDHGPLRQQLQQQGCCCPALLLELDGPLLRISAAAVHLQVCVQPITTLMLVDVYGHHAAHTAQQARSMRAIKDAVAALLLQYTSLQTQQGVQPAAAPLASLLPYPLAARSLAGERVQLLVQDKQLYRVGPPGPGASSCFKYTQRYGEAVHRAWAEAGHAPQLRGCRKLPGGWWEVEMEMLEPAEGWELLCNCKDALALLPEVESALRRAHSIAINGRQQRGVHGDIRGANVFVRRAGGGSGSVEVRFVDFDSAGPAGKVVYPAFMHPLIKWHPQARTCLPIRQEHDLHLLLSGQL